MPTFALSRCDWKSAESIALAKSGPNLSFAAFVAAVSSAAESSSPFRPVLASVEAMLRSSSAAMGTREPSEEIVLSSCAPPATLPAIPCERSALVRAASAFARPNLSRPTVAIARPATTATVATARPTKIPAGPSAASLRNASPMPATFCPTMPAGPPSLPIAPSSSPSFTPPPPAAFAAAAVAASVCFAAAAFASSACVAASS